jgi:hypothetical protein
MYLLPPTRPAVNNRKWNLGRLGLQPVQLRGLGCNCSAMGVGRPPQKRMGQLGDNTAGVPAGTVLAYSGNWPFGLTQGHGAGMADLISRVSGKLASKWGIIVDQSTSTNPVDQLFSQTQSLTLQVHTNSDYGAPQDIQSIIDGEIYPEAGNMPRSTIRVVKAVAPPPASTGTQFPADKAAIITAAQQGYQNAVAQGDSASANQFAKQIVDAGGQDPRGATGWLTDNWPWLAAAGVGLVVVREML